jgi:hypothetical protein
LGALKIILGNEFDEIAISNKSLNGAALPASAWRAILDKQIDDCRPTFERGVEPGFLFRLLRDRAEEMGVLDRPSVLERVSELAQSLIAWVAERKRRHIQWLASVPLGIRVPRPAQIWLWLLVPAIFGSLWVFAAHLHRSSGPPRTEIESKAGAIPSAPKTPAQPPVAQALPPDVTRKTDELRRAEEQRKSEEQQLANQTTQADAKAQRLLQAKADVEAKRLAGEKHLAEEQLLADDKAKAEVDAKRLQQVKADVEAKRLAVATHVTYSLKAAKKRILDSNGSWRQVDTELLNLGGINKVEGFIRDSTNADLILYGKIDPASSVLTLDDLVVVLRARFKCHESPVLTLSRNEGEWKHVFEPMELAGTAFADTCTRAAIELNELAFGRTSTNPKGLKTYVDDQSELLASSLQTGDQNESPVFGFLCSEPRFQVDADIWYLADLKIRVKARLPTPQFPDHAAEAFAIDATSRIDELFGSNVDFNRMRRLYELTALVAALEYEKVNIPDLQWWLETYPLAGWVDTNNAAQAGALDSQRPPHTEEKRLAEEQRMADEKAKAEVEAKRLQQAKAEEETKRLAEEKRKAEEQRMANEKAKADAEAKRADEEKRRLQAEAEEARIAEQRRLAEERVKAEATARAKTQVETNAPQRISPEQQATALDDLTKRYARNEIGPNEYQRQRAAILRNDSGPEATSVQPQNNAQDEARRAQNHAEQARSPNDTPKSQQQPAAPGPFAAAAPVVQAGGPAARPTVTANTPSPPPNRPRPGGFSAQWNVNGETATLDLSNGKSLVDIVFVRVPGGTYTRGNGGEDAPRVNATLEPFYLSKDEISAAAWQLVFPNSPPPSREDASRDSEEGISWSDAQAFCQAIQDAGGALSQVRLPLEVEWEYVAQQEFAKDKPQRRFRALLDGLAEWMQDVYFENAYYSYDNNRLCPGGGSADVAAEHVVRGGASLSGSSIVTVRLRANDERSSKGRGIRLVVLPK